MTWCSVDRATPRFDLASSAIRCRFVYRFARPKVLSRVSRQQFSPRGTPLSSVGSQWARFPDVVGRTEVLRLPAHAFPVTYLFRFRDPRDSSHSCSLLTALPAGEVPHRARILVQPAIPIVRLAHRVDMCGSSQVPRRSILYLCLGLGPRPNRRSLACIGLVDAAPAATTAKASAWRRYRGYREASVPAVYASRAMLPPPMQDSLPVGWLAFSGRESNPLDRVERFPSWYISVSLSWIYPDAMSLPPRRGGNAASVRFRHPMLPSPYGSGLGPQI